MEIFDRKFPALLFKIDSNLKILKFYLLQIILSLDRYLYHITNRLLFMTVNSVLFIIGTVGIKLAISHLLHVEDDVSLFVSYICF